MVSAVDRDKLAEYAGRHPIDWTWLLRARFGLPPGPFCDHEHDRTIYWDAMRIALAASSEP